ncbi:hypothetical protein C7T35_09025 [Variovorax sp. WS11]|uniref:hypothetical protein n=1 Tax=Variovorax sp. WS11 TaxID=1105204 RepID=UPI000D0DA72B|nr:hypothetical protein [Variovorax sp. WS11]NDZ17892.1 hypothetical protein [Variovorax sp. WS11]PSL85019.1 hypothetical protein C7T35_09025 [Variovorax sp. WS11]
MNLNRSPFLKLAAVGALAASALFAAASANAGASWSVGIDLPGVAIGVAEPGPVQYYQPAPVYSAPAPVYYEPAPRAYYRPPPPVDYRPAPVYDVQPAPGYWRGERWRHRHHQRDWDDRGDRDYRY